MKLGTKGRYAVMAMVDLAGSTVMNGKSSPMTLADIAERQEISLSYLEQLFSRLRKAGLVKSVRGPGGGYMLARAADQLRISDIVMAVDEPIRVTRCNPNSGAGCMPDGGRCVTHDLWEELSNHIYLFLNTVTLEDVCARRVLGASGVLHTAQRNENQQQTLTPASPASPVAAE
ncbi:MAG: Rrf2 family transcriptional regulator [Rhodospirillaceae bacterium]|jgi:Rrf2 family transcriptional regulator, iron-sulfur cluster assembly transcription factor|nr:Rrf2 family transcriptional regulator [Rhodospirillaceae bacterium]MBT3627609.1 Rrf2 family transcriptional regulator [Rhodospirillaceae bacterium]MBT3925421.1 Rrf2 family transcriptional regulator [Rhodospirillaceae bacterium]MBT4427248.1 Rrf2 family transcriptional regulator [Rhodospirillaceae bacterium]MBT5037642.1 Rrf2 family transcriptional regulator [Rhodospirillaceae bacterium]